MDLISLIVVLVVVGLLLWLVNAYIPMEPSIKQILNVVVIIWLLKVFGIFGVIPPLILSIVVALVVVGILLWLVNTYIPMAPPIKQILNIVVIIIVVIWLIASSGLLSGLPNMHVGKL
jgi:predicted membrane protein